MLDGLPRKHFRVIYADPPWLFKNLWLTPASGDRDASAHYPVMSMKQIAALPVGQLAADDCCLFMWCPWIHLPEGLKIIKRWGFVYKTCAFDWMKADVRQIDLFKEEGDVDMGMGYWTRANTEPCLLATRGKPKRLNADVRQGIIAKRREHSRKPDGVHERIERLVAGPYLELFARQSVRPGWMFWGNETDKFNDKQIEMFPEYDAAKNAHDGYYEAIRVLREDFLKQRGEDGLHPDQA